jgi:hypothetical protein
MANTPAINFHVDFHADGSGTALSVAWDTDPVVLEPSSSGLLNPVFGALPSSVVATTVSGGSFTIASQSWNNLTKVLSVTFDSTPPNGNIFTLHGYAVY